MNKKLQDLLDYEALMAFIESRKPKTIEELSIVCDKCVPDTESGNHCLECGRDCTEDLVAEAEYKRDWR